jgi:hypothetical protein
MKAKIGTIAVLAVLIVILALALLYAYAGLALPGAAIPKVGWIALALGTLFSLVVGIGLMALVFYSSRRGYDEPPHLENDSTDGSRT